MAVFVGTTAGAYRLDARPEQILDGTRVNHVHYDGSSVWMVDGKGRIHRDGGVVTTMPPGVIPLCIAATPETIWIGANEARLFGIEHGQLAEDEFFANAPGRDRWHTPWGGPPDVRSMTLDADHTLYINVHVGGILRYDNTGVNPTIEIDADVHEVAAHPSEKGAVFAACAYGLAASHNGHDFTIRDAGLHASYCRALAVLPEMVIVSASTGPRTSRGRLYRTPLWDGELEPVTAGLPDWFDDNVDTHCLLSRDGGVFVGHGGTVWASDDDGASWQELIGGLPKITCLG